MFPGWSVAFFFGARVFSKFPNKHVLNRGRPPARGGPTTAQPLLFRSPKLATVAEEGFDIDAPDTHDEPLVDLMAKRDWLRRNSTGMAALKTKRRIKQIERELESEYSFTIIERDADRPWMVLSNEHRNQAAGPCQLLHVGARALGDRNGRPSWTLAARPGVAAMNLP